MYENDTRQSGVGMGDVFNAGARLLGAPPPDDEEDSAAPGVVTIPAAAQAQPPSPEELAQVPVAAPSAVPYGASLGPLLQDAQAIHQAGQQMAQQGQQTAQGLRDAYAGRRQALQQTMDVGRQQANVEAQGAEDRLQAIHGYQQHLERLRKEEDDHVNRSLAELREASQDVMYSGVSRGRRQELQSIINNPDATPTQKARAQSQLDKARDDQAGGNSVGAVIGLALISAYGSPSDVMDRLKFAAEQRAQKRAARQQSYQNLRQEQADTLADMQRRRGSFEAEYNAQIEMAKARTERMMAGTKDQEVLARGNELLAKLGEEQAKTIGEYGRQASSDFLDAKVKEASIHGNIAGLQEQKAGRMAAQQREDAKANSVDRELVVPGVEGVAISKDAAKKAIELKNTADANLSNLRRLIDLRKKHGGGWIASKSKENAADYAIAQQIATELRTNQRAGMGLGTLSEGDKALLEEFIKDPTAYSPMGGTDAAIHALYGRSLEKTDQQMKNYGLGGYRPPEVETAPSGAKPH